MLFDTRVRRRFHQSANSYELEGDPRGTDARSSSAFNHRRRGSGKVDRGSSVRLVEAPVSYGGRFGASGGEDSLSKCVRERERERRFARRRATRGTDRRNRVEKG